MTFTLGFLRSDLPWPAQVLAGIAAVAWMCLARKLWTYVVDYRMTDAAFEIVLLRVFIFKRVLFTEIRDVGRVSLADLLRGGGMFFAIGIGNRLFAPRVQIRRHKGVPIIITPGDTDAFVAELTRRARASAG